MPLSYKFDSEVHVLTLSGTLTPESQENLQLQLKRIMQPKMGKLIHLTLDCSGLTESDKQSEV